jgi:serine/threonine protein kinase
LFSQIVSAVSECHFAKVFVGDIKPESIFIYQNEINGKVQLCAFLADLKNTLKILPKS